MINTNPNLQNRLSPEERFINSLKKIIKEQATAINQLEERIVKLEAKK